MADSSGQRSVTKARVEALEATAAGLAHALGNPVSGLAGQLEILRRRITDGAEAERLLRAVESASASLAELERIVKDLQGYCRHRRARSERTDLAEAVERLAGAEREAVRPRTIAIDVRASSRPFVTGDPAEIAHALSCLVSRALETTPDGSTLEISVESDPREARVSFAAAGAPPVEDFGIGYSARRPSRGLAVAVAERIAHQHGGRVVAEFSGGRNVLALELPLSAG